MAEYRQSAHAVFDLKYHIMWCTKYRKKVLRGRIAERARPKADILPKLSFGRDDIRIPSINSPLADRSACCPGDNDYCRHPRSSREFHG
jgi:REP-associated tyrosine transposase